MNAGAGALAVTVDGPSKVQLDCKEVTEGKFASFLFPANRLLLTKVIVSHSHPRHRVTISLRSNLLASTLPVVHSNALSEVSRINHF